ncbi:hypothetical protein T08_920 [Trichinella sp. T8]|nr:hypothetical protein T08_920 [Trichinella sp. T8]
MREFGGGDELGQPSGVPWGLIFENLKFWNFCRRRSPEHSLRANIF